jgi:hypothetical protein
MRQAGSIKVVCKMTKNTATTTSSTDTAETLMSSSLSTCLLPSPRHSITKDADSRGCRSGRNFLSCKSRRLCLGNYFSKVVSITARCISLHLRCCAERNALAIGSWEGWRSQPAVALACRPRAFDSAETAFLPLATTTPAPQTGLAMAAAPPLPQTAPSPQKAPAPTAACLALRPWERWPWPWPRDGPSRFRPSTRARTRLGHVRRDGGPRAGALGPTLRRPHVLEVAVPLRPCPDPGLPWQGRSSRSR